MNNTKQTVEELINRIKLLESALSFYANETNYKNNYVLSDNGYQARYVLEQARVLDNNIDIMKRNIEEYIKENNINDPESINDIENTLEKLTEINKIVVKYKDNGKR